MIIVRSVLSFTGTPNNGSLPIGNGQGFTINTLTAGTNITITNGPGIITIDAAGGGGSPAGSTNEIQFNNAGTFAADSDLRWIISDDRLVLGQENTADTNSRMVIIGKGISTNNTFVVHNSTGTNNALSVRDDGRVNVGGGRLHVGNASTSGRIWFGNAASPTAANNGFIDLDSASSATGSEFNIPGTDANNETTRIVITHRGRADGIRFYPAITGGSSANAGKSVIGKGTVGGGTFGIDFRFYGTATSQTLGQSEAFRFYSSDVLNTVVNNVLRFQIGNGAAVVPSVFVNSQLGLTDNNSITVDNSALLDLQSTTKGFLPPRNADPATNIATPAEGLIAFDTTDKKLQVFDGTNWIDLH